MTPPITRLTDELGSDYLERAGVVPLMIEDGRVRLGTWRKEVETQVVDDLRLIFSLEPELVQIDEDTGFDLIRRHYGDHATSAEEVIAGISDPAGGGDGASPSVDELPIDDLRSLASEAPVVKLVNFLLLEALEARASDVHLETYAHGLNVRYRIDGILQDAPSPPRRLAPAVASRVKIMADLDIAERRIPQDGRIRLTLQDRQVDVRVSTLPALHGESIVLRLLDKDSSRIGIEDLGMSSDTLQRFLRVVELPHGIVLATGPTGSGKTTTLYAAINHVRTGREKIITVEDPVEYELPGVPQVAVNEKVGLTFANALRSLLRQDPDVMLVGEIRDEETADVATHAALTGHLVLSTLHTNDAASALTRLLDLGVPSYLVGSTVEAILAQRLVRRTCEQCAEWTRPEAGSVSALGLSSDELPQVRIGRGCDACRGTGYRGRTGIYELLVMNDGLRESLTRDPGTSTLRKLAITSGMATLRDDGVRLTREGITTAEEVLRVTAA
jgi:type II secretion system protein E